MSIAGIGSIVSGGLNTTSGGGQANAGKAYADKLWDSGSSISQYWKDHYGDNAKGKALFEGYEQWIENEALKTMQKCEDDMAKNNG